MPRPVGLDAHGEPGQHVRPVGEPGDLAEALGLALGAEGRAGHVEAFQRLVGRRIDLDLGLQREDARGDAAMVSLSGVATSARSSASLSRSARTGLRSPPSRTSGAPAIPEGLGLSFRRDTTFVALLSRLMSRWTESMR